MADFADTLNAVVIGNMITQPGRGEVADGAARQRAKNIQDNSGIQAQDIAQYRNEHGGRGWLKGIGLTVAGLAVGALFVTGFGAGALLIGAIVGAVGGSIAMGHQSEKVRNGYDHYLDDVAARGREIKGASQTRDVAQEYDNGAGRVQSQVEALKSRATQAVAQGNGR